MKRTCLLLIVGLLLALPSSAELGRKDRKAAESMLKGRLYTRMDLPCATGRHAYGTYKRPLVEVNAEGANTDADTDVTANWWYADSTYWGVLINDEVEVEDTDWDDDVVEIEVEGRGRADDEESVVKFFDIKTLEDFKAAFELTFSRVPLQDEHPDWPADIKEAIAQREFVEGMTKRQVFYISGRPESVNKDEENGVKIETWRLRTSKGVKTGFWVMRAENEEGRPGRLRFEDGKLTGMGSTSSSGDDLNLDD